MCRGTFDVVIAYKSNRMGRDMLQSLLYEQRLSKLDIRVVYAKEEFGDNAAGRFALRSMMNVSQFYSENMAEDIKRGMMYNAERCMISNGSIPIGYKSGEDKKYALDPPNAAIVQEIFERVANGEQFTSIAKDLNARGIKTKQGNEWKVNSFQNMIQNERYTGVYIYDIVRIEGGIPQIIDKELFLKVQELLHKKKNPRGRHRVNGDYLLTGKLFCGRCGSPMVGISGTSKTKDLHYYYVCKAKREKGGCNKAPVRREWAEKEVAAALKSILSDDKMVSNMVDGVIQFGKEYRARSDIAILENQLRDIDKAINNMATAIEQGVVTATTTSRLLELEAEQKKVQNKLLLERVDILDVPRGNLVLWFCSFREGDINDVEYQRKLIDNVLIAAFLYDDHFKIEFNATGSKRKHKAPFKFVDNIEFLGDGASSYKLQSAPPKQYQTNSAKVYIVDGVFVLVHPFNLIRK